LRRLYGSLIQSIKIYDHCRFFNQGVFGDLRGVLGGRQRQIADIINRYRNRYRYRYRNRIYHRGMEFFPFGGQCPPYDGKFFPFGGQCPPYDGPHAQAITNPFPGSRCKVGTAHHHLEPLQPPFQTSLLTSRPVMAHIVGAVREPPLPRTAPTSHGTPWDRSRNSHAKRHAIALA